MQELRILVPSYIMPDSTSVVTQFFENLLPVLRTKVKVHVLWLVYQPDELKSKEQKFTDATILDIHNYDNAVEVLLKEKPDIIYADASWSFIDYALISASKFLNIPTFTMIPSYGYQMTTSKIKRIKLKITRFFESRVPTDTNQKKIMRRGRFYSYKILFLLKTQKTTGLSKFKIIQIVFMLFKLILFDIAFDSRFATTFHFLENEVLMKNLVDLGFPKSSLIVTGNPMYDNVFKKLQTPQSNHQKENTIKILLVTDALHEHGFYSKKIRDMMIKEIVSEISKHKGEMSLTIKIHPTSENLSEYESIVNSIDSQIPIFQKGDVIQFMLNSDVILSTSSYTTALIYALIAKKPIIICNFINLGHDLFLEKGLALECKNSSEIISIIKQSMLENFGSTEKINDFINEFLYKFDGKSAERISDVIMKLIN